MRLFGVVLKAALIAAAVCGVQARGVDEAAQTAPADRHTEVPVAFLRAAGDTFGHASGVHFQLVDAVSKSTGGPDGWPFHCPTGCPGPSLEPPIRDATVTDHGLGAQLYLDGETTLIKHRFLDASGDIRHTQSFSLNWPDICGVGVYYAPAVFGGGVCLTPGSVFTWWNYPHGSPGRWKWQLLVGATDEVVKEVEFDMRPSTILKVSGDGASGVVGEALREPLVVRMTDVHGNPVNYPINGRTRAFTYSIRSPGGASGASVQALGHAYPTVDGKVSLAVVLGSKAGTYRVSVEHPEAGNVTLTFNVTAVERLEPEDNEEQEEEVGEDPCAKLVGNPISVGIGNKVEHEVDYARSGLSPLEFVRVYNSFGSKSRVTGNYWSTTFDRFVILPQTQGAPIRLRRPDGRTIRYDEVGGQLVSKPFFKGRLERTASGFRYTETDGTVETFDDEGRLQTIVDLHGRILTAEHRRQNGRLIKVTANTGESLAFAYDSFGQLSKLTDHTGRSWTYTYNAYANLLRVVDPDGDYRKYHYEDADNPWLLSGVSTFPFGTQFEFPWDRHVTWTYDAEGRATSSFHRDTGSGGPNLRQVDIAYAEGGTRIVTDSRGNSSEYHLADVDGRQFVERIDGAAAATCGSDLALEYDADMNVVAETRFGTRTEYGDYDAKGQPGHVIRSAGTALARRTDIEYDTRFVGRPTRIVEPSVAAGRHRITEIQYNAAGDATEVGVSGYRPDGTSLSRVVRYEYDGPFGQLSRIDGPREDVADHWRFEYHATSKRLSRVIDPNGIVRRDNIQYTGTGKILSEDRPNGLRVSYAYHAGSDLLKSVTETQGELSRSTTWAYDERRRVTSIAFGEVGGEPHRVHFTYNVAGDLMTVRSEGDGVIHLQRDRDGNIVRSSTGSRWMERTFDAYRHVDQVINPNNGLDFDFHPDGRVRRFEDGKGQETRYDYDELERLTTVFQPGGVETQYGYDVQDNLVRVLAGNQAATDFAYDDLGNLLREDSPDRGTTHYQHDSAGNVVARTDAKGQHTTYSYDAAGRLLAVDRAGTDYDETYVYDTCPHGIGRLCSVVNGLGEYVAFEYDRLGRVAAQITPDGVVHYRRDHGGRVLELVYPSGRMIEFERNPAGRPSQVRVNDGGIRHMLLYQVQTGGFGHIRSWRFGNGRLHTRSLDEQHWPVRFGTDGVTRLDYVDFDGNGNIERIDVDGTPHRYAYDEQDRLTRFTPPWADLGYAYDPVGNRTRLDDLAAATTVPYAYQPASNRIQGDGDRSHVLDDNGNTIGRSGFDQDGVEFAERFDYSAHNRLIGYASRRPSSAPWTEHAQYRYNPLGQRVAKTVDGLTTRFVYGLDGQLLAELDEAGSVLQEYVHLDGIPVALLGPPVEADPGLVVDHIEDNVPYNPVVPAFTERRDNQAVGGTYLESEVEHWRMSYMWSYTAPVTGNYEIQVRWLRRPNDGVATVYTVAGTDLAVRHAEQSKGTWVSLGTHYAPAGTRLLEMPGVANAGPSSAGRIVADAARFVLVSQVPPSGTPYRYIHSDHLNTPRALTDSTGNVVWRAAYDAFGAATVDADPDGDGTEATLNLRFPGQYFDQETGLHYNYFRTYDPGTGRYLESDPIGLAGGVNTFAYVGGNPLAQSDPLGLHPLLSTPAAYFLGREVGPEVVLGVAPGYSLIDCYLNGCSELEWAFNIGTETPWGKVLKFCSAVGPLAWIAKGERLPKPATGPGSTPKSERDPKRFFTPSEREVKRAEQNHQCGNGCGTRIDESNSAGHHIERHADGGRTIPENHAEVCIDCHKALHSWD